jgi:cytochrome c-type biogenesis protein CcmH
MRVVHSFWVRLLLFVVCATSGLRLDGAAVVSAQASAESRDRLEDALARATSLEGRLRAPCCWTQTIDVHDSDVARGIHREIVARLQSGASPKQIEDVLVARYGERMRAVPAGNPLYDVALVLAFIIALAAVALFFAARRWRRVSERSLGVTNLTGELDEYDELLRRELAELS